METLLTKSQLEYVESYINLNKWYIEYKDYMETEYYKVNTDTYTICDVQPNKQHLATYLHYLKTENNQEFNKTFIELGIHLITMFMNNIENKGLVIRLFNIIYTEDTTTHVNDTITISPNNQYINLCKKLLSLFNAFLDSVINNTTSCSKYASILNPLTVSLNVINYIKGLINNNTTTIIKASYCIISYLKYIKTILDSNNINLHDNTLPDNKFITEFVYNMLKVYIANVGSIIWYNEYINNKLVIIPQKHDILLSAFNINLLNFVSGCYVVIDTLIDNDTFFISDITVIENVSKTQKLKLLKKVIMHCIEYLNKLEECITYPSITNYLSLDTYNKYIDTYQLSNTIGNHEFEKCISRTVFIIFKELIIFYKHKLISLKGNATEFTAFIKHYNIIIKYCFYIELKCYKLQYITTNTTHNLDATIKQATIKQKTIPNIHNDNNIIMKLTLEKALSTIYLWIFGTVNNYMLVPRSCIEVTGVEVTGVETSVYDGIKYYIGMFVILTQLIDDLHDFDNDIESGIMTSSINKVIIEMNNKKLARDIMYCKINNISRACNELYKYLDVLIKYNSSDNYIKGFINFCIYGIVPYLTDTEIYNKLCGNTYITDLINCSYFDINYLLELRKLKNEHKHILLNAIKLFI
jgi:hypothetical protein